MNNKIGISSGCYYPKLTENIIKNIADAAVSEMEFFINTHSEMLPDYIKTIRNITDYYGIHINSVHPFTSFAETYLFFSDYSRRFEDGICIYDRYFEICSFLGAKILNFHGLKSEKIVSFEKYCDVYGILYERAKKEGIILSQENVRKHVCGNLDYIKRFSDYLGNNVSFTFDIKQAYMSGYDPLLFVKAVSDKTVLIHLNDFNSDSPCLLPGKGKFNIKQLFSNMNSACYSGNYIIEVYSNAYSDESEIIDSVKHSYSVLKGCIQ